MPAVARRTFLTSLATSIAAPAILRSQTRPKRLPIAFSTIGCPLWSWKAILEAADKLGYAAIEIRVIQNDADLPRRPEFTGSRLAESRRDLDAVGVKLVNLGSGVKLHEKDAAARAKHLEDGRRFIDLAHALEVPYIRVFPDKLPKDEPKSEVLARIVDGGRQLAAQAKGSGVTVLLESHGEVVRADDLEPILTGVGSDQFALLWDAHHTFVAGKEDPGVTYARLTRWVRHVHLKDSKPAPDGKRRYVFVGEGEVPVKEQVRLLVAGGYKGYYSFEWEKRGQPDIEEPEVAFPHYVKVIGEYLSAAGYKA
jgi:sugar phosphate isomerase/epimerase